MEPSAHFPCLTPPLAKSHFGLGAGGYYHKCRSPCGDSVDDVLEWASNLGCYSHRTAKAYAHGPVCATARSNQIIARRDSNRRPTDEQLRTTKRDVRDEDCKSPPRLNAQPNKTRRYGIPHVGTSARGEPYTLLVHSGFPLPHTRRHTIVEAPAKADPTVHFKQKFSNWPMSSFSWSSAGTKLGNGSEYFIAI